MQSTSNPSDRAPHLPLNRLRAPSTTTATATATATATVLRGPLEPGRRRVDGPSDRGSSLGYPPGRRACSGLSRRPNVGQSRRYRILTTITQIGLTVARGYSVAQPSARQVRSCGLREAPPATLPPATAESPSERRRPFGYKIIYHDLGEGPSVSVASLAGNWNRLRPTPSVRLSAES